MYGEDGADTFVMFTPSNVNNYATIMDLASGDIIKFDAGSVFSSAKISLGNTAVFQDFANEAVNVLAGVNGTDTNGDIAWFQFDEDKDGVADTYIVQNDDSAGESGATDFENGEDSIIKILGEVDLSTASYNQTDGTLEMA